MKNQLRLPIMLMAISFIAGLSSCVKDATVYYQIPDMTVNVQPATGDIYQIYYFPLNHADVQAAAGTTDMSTIVTAKLKTLTANAVATGVTFDGISGIEVYYKSNNSPTDSIQIAYTTTLASGATTFDFKMNGSEMKKSLTEDGQLIVKVLPKPAGTGAFDIKLTSGKIEIEVKKR